MIAALEPIVTASVLTNMRTILSDWFIRIFGEFISAANGI